METLGPSRDGGVADPVEILPSPHMCYVAKFGRSGSNDMSVLTENFRDILTPRVSPYKIIQDQWN